MLDGVLGCELKLLVERQEEIGHGSKGAGEPVEAFERVSNSGVHGSRYGFVVLMKVTGDRQLCEGLIEAMYTISGDVHPYCVIIECVLVGIEAFQGVLIP